MPRYQVLVDDNFHYQAADERRQERTYDSLEEALAACRAIVDRSLFSPSRRPPPAAPPPVVQVPAASVQPSAPPNVILLGVVMDGQNARAVVQVGADKRLLRAQMGDDIDGWKVAQIDGRKVVLASQDGRFATYRLFNDERGGAGAGGGARSDGPKNSQMQQAPSPTGGLELVQQTRPR